MNNSTEQHDDSEPLLGPQEIAFESQLRRLRPSKLSSQTENLFDISMRPPLVSWRQLAATVAASWVVGALFGGAAIWTWMSSNRSTSELIASPTTESQNSLAIAKETNSPMPLPNDWEFMDSFLDKQENLSPRTLGLMRGRLTRSRFQSDNLSTDEGDTPNVSSDSETPITQQEILHDLLQSLRVN